MNISVFSDIFYKFSFLRTWEITVTNFRGSFFSAFERLSNLMEVSAKKEKGLLQLEAILFIFIVDFLLTV